MIILRHLHYVALPMTILEKRILIKHIKKNDLTITDKKLKDYN